MSRCFFISVFLMLVSGAVRSQDCSVIDWAGNKSFIINDENKARLDYDQICSDTSSNWHILLVRFGRAANSPKSVYISTCGNRLATIKKEGYSETSITLLDSTNFQKLNKVLNSGYSRNGFFSGRCDGYVSYHKMEFFVIKNQKLNKWIEMFVTDGNLREVLRGKKDYEFILNLYEILDVIK